MLKMKREEVDQLAGRRKAVQPVPSPAAADPGLAAIAAQLAATAQTMAQAASIMANRPKQLEAVVRRDKEGRMSGVTITVI